MTRTLVVGGTGPTGPAIVTGLLERGHDVTVLHRGTHETDELPDVEHVHCDPHFEDSLRAGLGDRTFDLALGMYGRTRIVGSVLAGRCERFIGIGGVPVYEGFVEPDTVEPYGMPLMIDETAPLAGPRPDASGEESPARTFARKLVRTEQAVFELHRNGAFAATWLRYPSIYGPRNPTPWEWSVIKRVQDGRSFIIVPDGGLSIRSRMASVNASQMVLIAVDHPAETAGQVFNCADDHQYSLRQWIEVVAVAAGGRIECLSLPFVLATPAHALLSMRGMASPHVLVDTTKARTLLGYRDLVTPEDAISESVRWYIEHPVTPESHPRFTDPFDYEREDLLAALYQRAVSDIEAQVRFETPEYHHGYAHPKDPGQDDQHGR